MRRIWIPTLLPTVLACGVLYSAGCSDSGGNSLIAGIVSASLESAVRADLSGQQDIYTGDLGNGVTFTFPAVKGQVYHVDFEGEDADDEVTFDVLGDDGSGLKSKSRKTGEVFVYTHENHSQHVLMICRPRNPLHTIEVKKLRLRGTGTFSPDTVHVNVFVAGAFTGYGAYNDLATAADQGAFTDAVMTKVQTLFQQAGIAIRYEGFAYTADQVRQINGRLVGTDDQTICAAGESMSSTGFEVVSKEGIDAWGNLGFPATDPNFDRGHGIDVFVIHHFTNDGTVGLSPRPGMLLGNGPDTALAVGAFLQQGGSLIPRTPDQIATVLTHEIGHFLGLLHTTTFKPSPSNPTEAVDDGIADTPRCTVLSDNNNDGMVGIGDGCQDEDNIMFYQAGAQTIFSATQGQVMRNLLSLQEH